MFKNHIAYYKNNPKGLWFKRKLYGWGWTPVKWQGWVVLLVWLLVFASLVLNMDAHNNGWPQDFVIIFVSFVVLICICYAKGEKPKWQWGTKNLK